MNSLIATKQIPMTHRNSSTEMAEPSPISRRPIDVRYASSESTSVPFAPFVMMNTLSKMRNASRARNRTATMIAAFMFGRTTRCRRCHAVAPSTCAASSSSPGTCESPASRSSEMNGGVVFQISEAMMTNRLVPWCANQLRSGGSIPGTQSNQWLTKPELMSNA